MFWSQVLYLKGNVDMNNTKLFGSRLSIYNSTILYTGRLMAGYVLHKRAGRADHEGKENAFKET